MKAITEKCGDIVKMTMSSPQPLSYRMETPGVINVFFIPGTPHSLHGIIVHEYGFVRFAGPPGKRRFGIINMETTSNEMALPPSGALDSQEKYFSRCVRIPADIS